MSIKEILAEHLREQARWRSEKAAEYPEDVRNQRCADGLEEFAAYVESLPDQDERLVELSHHYQLDVQDGVFRPYSQGMVQRTISRFRFDDPKETPERALRWIVEWTPQDLVELAKIGGAFDTIEDDDDDD